MIRRTIALTALAAFVGLHAVGPAGLATAAENEAAGDSQTTLVPHKATYKIKISIASGRLETNVMQTEAGFSVVSVIEPTGLANIFLHGNIEERAEFDAGPDGITPRRFSSNDQLTKGKPVQDFTFDWDGGVVGGTINDEPYEYELSDNMRDRVTIQYQLMHNLVSGIEIDEYRMLDGDEIKDLTVTSLGTRDIKVPFGTYEAIGVQHQAAGSKRISTLWLAEELGYLPVLIEQHRKGKRTVRAVLTDYVAGDTTLSASNE